MRYIKPKDVLLSALIGYVITIQPIWDYRCGPFLIWIMMTLLSLSALDDINRFQAKRKRAHGAATPDGRKTK